MSLCAKCGARVGEGDTNNGDCGHHQSELLGFTATWWMASEEFVDPDQGVYMVARSTISDRYYAESKAAAQRLAMALNVVDTLRPGR